MNFVNHLNMCLVNLGDVYTLVNLVKCVLHDVSLFFVILVHLMILTNDVYFGEK